METNNNQKKNEIAQNKMFGSFDPFFDNFFGFPIKNEFRNVSRVMKTDVIEKGDSYAFEIEVPGIKKENISLEFDNGYLTISAKQKYENDEKDKNGNYVCRERHYGSFSRSFYVGDINEDQISASLEDGILKVVVPKEHETPKKHIEIKWFLIK